ncbi:MAG: hypothetical protein QOC83_4204 [Pseudonocardiales bacterium]|jgi:AcrR family transcriptional regulator|nr:hypothetical protein [Pseudonocardiales bacterium]
MSIPPWVPPSVLPESPARRPRADAERNRRRILEAARGLITERGAEVQLPEVARAAGVGTGTVYRHFASRELLVEALAELRFAEILEFAHTSCLPDREEGVARYLWHVGEVLATDRGLSSAIESARRTYGSPPEGQMRGRLEAAVAELIDHAVQARTVRADCTVADVFMSVGALSATIRAGHGDWRRLLTLLLDGLRARP